ncbi:MAG: serine/threonine protein kinase, partial [Deltaproteobacteria bacterium]|nr:serine/threonine protein kinase [Deltaproteobacteria bacterium]
MPRCPTCHRRVATACPDHGPVARAIVELRRVPIQGYELGELVGVGTTGAVWAGSGNTLIKVARAAGESVLAHEVSLFEALDGRIVPKLVAHGTSGNHTYLVVQRPPGRSLAHDLERGVASLDVIAPLARAIDELHRAGIIHGDLKPENIYVAREPAVTCTLVDLGNARRPGAPPVDPPIPFTRDRSGTPHYLAPEQVPGDGRPLNFATDVYAFGAICFEILCGRPPFIGTVAQVKQGHTIERPPRPSAIANVDPRYDAPILRCLAKEPGSRFASPRAAVEILTRIIAGSAGSSPGIATPKVEEVVAPPVKRRAGSQVGEDDEARPFARDEVYRPRPRASSQGDAPKRRAHSPAAEFARDEVFP